MNPEVIERVLSCPRLPSLPAVAMRVIELTQKSDVSVNEIAQTITNDQGLSSKVLRTVNSPFYALRKPCSSINQAIVMLGLSAVKTLALGFSLVSSVQEKAQGFDYDQYWKRCLITGVAAKCIAVEAKCGLDEECFLGGLLQDVGMVALYQALDNEYLAIIAGSGGDHRALAKEEMAALELTHADIGAMLAQRWKLPPELVMPVKFHERPGAAPQEYLAVCQAVGLGNIGADVVTAAEPALPLKRFYAKAQEWFNLSAAQCDAIIKQATQGVKEIARLLQIDAGPPVNADELLGKASAGLAAIALPFDASSSSLADTDEETGLPARTVFNQNIVAGFEQASRGLVPLSVAVVMIDGLDALAARHGPHVHCALMEAVAGGLQRFFDPHNGLVCRFDATRFGVVLGKTDRAAATRLCEQGRSSLFTGGVVAKAPGLKDVTVPVTISIGLVTLDQQTAARFADADALVKTATAALDAAARAGGHAMRVYAPKALAA